MTLPAPITFTLLGEPVRLAAPASLGLLAGVLLLALLGAAAIARRRRALRELAGELGARVAPGAGAARPALRLSLQVTGLALLALALSRPQCGSRTELGKQSGIDLVLALDVSRSMRATDEAPDRLGRARLETGALLDRLAGDRVAVVLFAGEAMVQCPLTTDYAAVRLLLRGAGPGSLARPGTDLAAALAASGEVLAGGAGSNDGPGRGGRARAVVLFSDGESHQPGAEEAAEALGAEGVRVFAVGLGSESGTALPALDEQGRVTGVRTGRDGQPIRTRLEEAVLRQVAERSGGRYFRAAGAVGLPELAAELARLDRSEVEGRTTVAWEERFALLAFPGFLALLAGALLRGRRRPTADLAGDAGAEGTG